MKRFLSFFLFFTLFFSFRVSASENPSMRLGFVYENSLSFTFSLSDTASYSSYAYKARILNVDSSGNFSFSYDSTVVTIYHVVGYKTINGSQSSYDIWTSNSPEANVLKNYTIVSPYYYSLVDGNLVVSGSVDVNNFPDYLEYPPVFPVHSGLSYSNRSPVYVTSMTASSSGIKIQKGFKYNIVDVTYTFNFNAALPSGSYMLAFPVSGTDTISGLFPDVLFASTSYVTDVTAPFNYYISGFQTAMYKTNYPIFHLCFDNLSGYSNISFTASYFVMSDVPSFNYSLSNSTTANNLFISDGNKILDEIEAFQHNEYPPSFPSSPGLSFSSKSNIYVTELSMSSSGVTIPDGYTSALLPVSFTFYFSDALAPGTYYLDYACIGQDDITGSTPNVLIYPETYISKVRSDFRSNISSMSYTQYSTSYPSVSVSFDSFYPSVRTLTFVASFYVRQNVSAFSLDMVNKTGANYLFIPDESRILDILSSAHGNTTGLDNQNGLMDKALSDYQRDTDTSKQYGNISDSLFALDTSIFVQVSSTISLFSSVVTGLFNAFGDLSVPLTMFLIVTVISCIIGIIKITSDSS